MRALLLASAVFIAACGGGGGGTIAVVPTPNPLPPPFDSTVQPVLSLRAGTPRFFTISPSPQLYAEVIIDAKDTAGNPKMIASIQNGTPAGIYQMSGSPTMQVSFIDPVSRTAVRSVMTVAYSTMYTGTFTLPDSFGNATAIVVSFTTPQAPAQPTVFATTLRSGYPQFAISGQNVSTTIIVDSNHTLEVASSGIPTGSISVADSTGATVTTTVPALGTSRNVVQLTASGVTGTAYVATLTLRDTDGNQSTLLVPFTTPGSPPVVGAFAISVHSGYPQFVVNGQNVAVSILIDGNHVIRSAPNGVTPWGTIGVTGGTGPTPARAFTFTPDHTGLFLQFTGARGTAYTATFALEDSAGNPSVPLNVSIVTP